MRTEKEMPNGAVKEIINPLDTGKRLAAYSEQMRKLIISNSDNGKRGEK